ncbi:50S ribosomal protein L17 [Candidatus Parcubacteria bacterium]|nr:50S ribosomal protein L17 [Candidatus Parcubacteria bacterium]
MHRNGYKGRKFGRERDQRRALIKSLANSLILNESIETTLPKAKEVVPYTEKLITKAKKGGLHERRQIVSSLQTVAVAHKLVDEIAPKLGGRNSGYFRIERTSLRRGDNAQMAKISFVDDLKALPEAKPVVSSKQKAVSIPKNTSSKTAGKPAVKKKSAKPAVKAKKEAKQ